MAVSALDRARYAYNAGFRNTAQIEALSIITAISLCECGVGQPCETSCVDVLGDSTCGIVQVDCVYHPNCGQAVDPQTAMDIAWQLSNHGTSFTPWATYTQTRAPNYFMTCLPAARAGVDAFMASISAPSPAPPPALPPSPPPPPPPAQSAINDGSAGLVLVLASIGLAAFALERTRPGSLTGILRSTVSASGVRSGGLRPLIRP